MIGSVERILFLRGIPLLAGFSLDELWQVSRVVTEVEFEPPRAAPTSRPASFHPQR